MSVTDFYYASARLRALEPKQLNASEIERMLGAKTAQEAYKVLTDLDYASHVGDIERVEEFQKVLTASLLDTKRLLERIVPDPRILDILLLPYDFHNLKTILKGMAEEKNRETVNAQLMPLGRASIEDLETFLHSKDKNHLPVTVEAHSDFIKETVKRARAAYERSDTTQVIDLIVDCRLYQLLLEIAQSTKNDFVIQFVQALIDVTNFKTLLRIKLLKQENEFEKPILRSHLFASNGNLPVSKFTKGLENDQASLANLFKGTDYEEMAQKSIEAFEKSHSFLPMEKYAEEYLTHLARKTRYTPVGPEVVIAYFFARQNNARLIRIIMVGKINGVPEKILREHLYSAF